MERKNGTSWINIQILEIFTNFYETYFLNIKKYLNNIERAFALLENLNFQLRRCDFVPFAAAFHRDQRTRLSSAFAHLKNIFIFLNFVSQNFQIVFQKSKYSMSFLTISV